MLWKVKIFKTRAAMDKFIAANSNKIQWVEIFVNNAFGIEYRRLRSVY